MLVLIGVNASPLGEKIRAIDGSQLGKTLLDTLQLHMGTSEPLERLIDTLLSLEDRYSKDQKEDDLNNREFQQQCDTDLATLKSEIDQINRNKVKVQGIIDQLIPLIEQKKSELKEKDAIRKQLRKDIGQIDLMREYVAKEFNEKRSEMSDLIKVLEEVKVIFATKFRSNYLEVRTDKSPVSAEMMLQVKNQLKKALKYKSFGKPYEQVINFLVELNLQQSNQGIVMNIVTLCDLLIKKIDEVWQKEKKAEDARVNWYQKYSKLMNTDFQLFDNAVNTLKAEIDHLMERLIKAQNELEDMNQRLAAKEEYYEDRRNECQEAAYDYTERRTARAEDRQVVSDVIGIINVNMRDLKSELALRMAAGSV